MLIHLAVQLAFLVQLVPIHQYKEPSGVLLVKLDCIPILSALLLVQNVQLERILWPIVQVVALVLQAPLQTL